MNEEPLADVVRNIDTRLKRVEQYLPALPTREELHSELEAAIAPGLAGAPPA